MKKKLILIACILFVGLNILLIAKSDGKVKRTAYISKWTSVTEKDMKETLDTTGVIDYADKEFVFLQNDHINIEAFLVDEGDFVNVGDTLYTYHINQYEDTQVKLEADIAALEKEIDAIEDAIKKANSRSIDKATLEVLSEATDDRITISQYDAAASVQIDQYIIEKEKELKQAEALKDSLQAQLQDLTAGSGIVHVPSPYTGYVTDISHSLDNPLMTIASEELYIVGELTERERHRVDMAMDVDVVLRDEQDSFIRKGIVDFVSDEPSDLSLHGKSLYPFYVGFVEDDEFELEDETEDKFDDELEEEIELLPGYHADLTITTAESEQALVVREQYVDEGSLWYMANDGRLRKRNVVEGLEMGKYLEIGDEFVKGDRVALGVHERFNNKSPFITKFKPKNSSWKVMFKDGAKKRSMLIALLAR